MGSKWEDFIDNLKDDAGTLAKGELKDLINGAKDDAEEFLKEQGKKMEGYLTQLAGGEIKKDQFESYMIDIKDLTEMKALQMEVAAKARAQKIVNGITSLIIDGLLKLI